MRKREREALKRRALMQPAIYAPITQWVACKLSSGEYPLRARAEELWGESTIRDMLESGLLDTYRVPYTDKHYYLTLPQKPKPKRRRNVIISD